MTSEPNTITIEEHDRKLAEAVADTLASARASYEDEIDYLKAQLEKARHELWGQKSEKRKYLEDPNQQSLFDMEEETPSPQVEEELEEVKEHKRRKPRKSRFPDNAERVVNKIELAEEDRKCACCGDLMQEIGYESSEKAHIVPAKCVIHEDQRVKYACSGCKEGGVAIAPTAPTAFPKTQITNETRSHILVSKFVDHLPYYRQSKILAREGVHLADSTLAHYGVESADALAPIAWAMLEEILKANYIQADETTLPVLKVREKGKGAHRGYLWGYAIPHGSVVFLYQHGRGKKYPNEVLADFKGILQTDRYIGYKDIQERADVIDVACWAHTRRRFREASKYAKKRAGPVLDLIGKIYKVDEMAREEQLSNRERGLRRQKYAYPVLSELHDLLESPEMDVRPSTPLGEAIAYAKTHWIALTEFLVHDEVELDTNLLENSMRPIALGRKNYLFAGSEGGAEAASVIYSLTESCRRLGIEPRAYLCYAFEQLAHVDPTKPEQYRSLTPAAYKLRD